MRQERSNFVGLHYGHLVGDGRDVAGAMGFYGSKGPFFAMPPMFLSDTALAAGFA